MLFFRTIFHTRINREANTCLSNQVLQGDGISCACPAGLVWDGASCIVACNPSTSVDRSACVASGGGGGGGSCSELTRPQTAACDSGFSGTKTRTVYTDSCTRAERYGAWDTSACGVACPIITSNEAAACDFPFVVLKTRTVSTNSCTGTTYGAWDTAGCTPEQKPTVCTGTIVFLGSSTRDPDLLDLTLPAGATSGTYCSGYTRNWAHYYSCPASGGVLQKHGIIQMGCRLFD